MNNETNWREECGMKDWDDTPDDSCAIFGVCNESECDYDNGDLLDYYEKKFHEHRDEINVLKTIIAANELECKEMAIENNNLRESLKYYKEYHDRVR